MSDNDLIRREYIGPRLAIAGFGGKALQDAIAALPAVTVGVIHEEQNTEQRKAFWNWLPLAYRDGHLGEEAKFTKYNMEVAHYAGWCAALEPVAAPDPAAIREHIEYAKRLRRYDWQEWTAQDIEDAEGIVCAFLDLIQKGTADDRA